MVIEFREPKKIGKWFVQLRIIGKSADIPEQHRFTDIVKGQSIKFDLTLEQLFNSETEPWLNVRHVAKGNGYREQPQISCTQHWTYPTSEFHQHKADLAHNTKNIMEALGAWICLTRISATQGNIGQIRYTFISHAISAVNNSCKYNTLSVKENVDKKSVSQVCLSQFRLDSATNLAVVLPLVCIPFFEFETNDSITKLKNCKELNGSNLELWFSIAVICNVLMLSHSGVIPSFYNLNEVRKQLLASIKLIGVNISHNKKKNFENESKHLLKHPTCISLMELIFDWNFVGGGYTFSTLKKEAYNHFLTEDVKRNNLKINQHKNATAITTERIYQISLKTLLEGIPLDKRGYFNLKGNNSIDNAFLHIDNIDYGKHSIFLTSLGLCVFFFFFFFDI